MESLYSKNIIENHFKKNKEEYEDFNKNLEILNSQKQKDVILKKLLIFNIHMKNKELLRMESNLNFGHIYVKSNDENLICARTGFNTTILDPEIKKHYIDAMNLEGRVISSAKEEDIYLISKYIQEFLPIGLLSGNDVIASQENGYGFLTPQVPETSDIINEVTYLVNEKFEKKLESKMKTKSIV